MWIALSVALAIFLSRTVRVAEARATDGTVSLSSAPFLEDASVQVVNSTAGTSLGSSR